MFLLIILASQTFYPNWPIFLHGYIRHIRDIFQLCLALPRTSLSQINLDILAERVRSRNGKIVCRE